MFETMPVCHMLKNESEYWESEASPLPADAQVVDVEFVGQWLWKNWKSLVAYYQFTLYKVCTN